LSESEIPKEEVPKITQDMGSADISTGPTTESTPVAPTSAEQSAVARAPTGPPFVSSNEASIRTLQDLSGISRTEACELLLASGGDVSVAMDLLLH
jgi:hypothetical protein